MNKILAAGAVSLGLLICGCSDNSESVETARAETPAVKTLHATRKVYAKNIIPRAKNLGITGWRLISR